MISLTLIATLSNAISVFMLWLFLSAGVSKLNPVNRHFYTEVLNDYGVALPDLARVLVWLLGVVEVLAAIFIILPTSRLLGAILCGALLMMYFCVIAQKIRQGKLDMNCGCAGPGGLVTLSPMLLLRNALLIGLLILLAATLIPSGFSLSSIQAFGIDIWLLSLVVAVMMIFIYLSAEHLLANQQKLALLKQHT